MLGDHNVAAGLRQRVCRAVHIRQAHIVESAGHRCAVAAPGCGQTACICHLTSHYITSHHSPLCRGWLRAGILAFQRFAAFSLSTATTPIRYWCVMIHLITAHHITSHHITSHHITSHHITSHHITSHHITSQHITTHHITSHRITSHHQPMGPLLRAVNAIAAAIAGDYPDVLVDTLAYQCVHARPRRASVVIHMYRYTQQPCKITKPARNVIIRLSNIESNFGAPLTDPSNAAFLNVLEGPVLCNDDAITDTAQPGPTSRRSCTCGTTSSTSAPTSCRGPTGQPPRTSLITSPITCLAGTYSAPTCGCSSSMA